MSAPRALGVASGDRPDGGSRASPASSLMSLPGRTLRPRHTGQQLDLGVFSLRSRDVAARTPRLAQLSHSSTLGRRRRRPCARAGRRRRSVVGKRSPAVPPRYPRRTSRSGGDVRAPRGGSRAQTTGSIAARRPAGVASDTAALRLAGALRAHHPEASIPTLPWKSSPTEGTGRRIARVTVSRLSSGLSQRASPPR